jgi:hypothetical protein
LASHILALTKDIGYTNPPSYVIVKFFKLEFVCQAEKTSGCCGKKDYIPTEIGARKHRKGRKINS